MADLLSPDGRFSARWYLWRNIDDRWDRDRYWRVEVLNPATGLVLLTRSYNHGYSRRSGHETGADVADCAFSPDSRHLRVRLSDGSSEDIDLGGLDPDPRFDETRHYRLDWSPLPPSGARIEIVGRTYGHPHRTLRVPPEGGAPPVRRIGFSEHPGLVALVRTDGSIETLPYGRRCWPDELEGLRLDPTGRFRGSCLSEAVGLKGDPGERRGSLAVWDAVSGRQVALLLGAPIASFAFEAGFRLRLVGEDGRVEERSMLDFLLPYGDLQLSPDRKRVLRFFTTLDDAPAEPERMIRWSLIEIIDAIDGRLLQRIVTTAPYARRSGETVTISDFAAIPEGPRLATPSPLAAVRFADPIEGRGLLRVTLDDGTERDLRLGER